MTEKKNPIYKVLALGIASLSLAGKKGKEILDSLEKEIKEKNLEEKIEKRFTDVIEKMTEIKNLKKEKIAEFFGVATKEEIEKLKKEIENFKHDKQ